MKAIKWVISILAFTLAAISCHITPREGLAPPPVVMLWDKIADGIDVKADGSAPVLALFRQGVDAEEFDFAPRWQTEPFISDSSGAAAFMGGEDSLSVMDELQCYDIISREKLFSRGEEYWVPLGFIEDGWALVALRQEQKFYMPPIDDPDRETGNISDKGYRLTYTVHLIDVLTGELDEGAVIYDVGSTITVWEDRGEFRPQLAPDSGKMFVASPDLPYGIEEIANENRHSKLWEYDLRAHEAKYIDLGDRIIDNDFSFIVNRTGGSIFFQSQREDETRSLRMPNYGLSERKWGVLLLWKDNAITTIAPVTDSHVQHQMGISRRGDILFYAQVEYDPVTKIPTEGTLRFYLNHETG